MILQTKQKNVEICWVYTTKLTYGQNTQTLTEMWKWAGFFLFKFKTHFNLGNKIMAKIKKENKSSKQ